MVGRARAGDGGRRLSAAKKPGRFGYLSGKEAPATPPEQSEDKSSREAKERGTREGSGGEVAATASPGPTRPEGSGMPTQTFSSVPKGRGRMKQERSQLNVRIPTSLKRQASAKAVLEGRDIGEVVEDLLTEYLSR